MVMVADAAARRPALRVQPLAVPAGSASVTVRNVGKMFGAFAAVDDVSFSVPRGSFVSLLGPSGSGKTTILRMIAGFTHPSSGDILINERPVAAVPPHKRSIGVVFQSLALFPHMTVAQNVAYPLKCRRFDRRRIPDLVAEYLSLVRLNGLESRRVDQLSGGQRQRVAIARALVYKPDILLLDEPLAALDKKLREEIQFEMRRIQQELKVTTINVTHDQREALVMSDEIIVMDGGRLQQRGKPNAIYERPTNRFVASFIGHTNVLSGPVLRFCRGDVAIGLGESEGYAAIPPSSALPAIGSTGECALRAEHILIGRCREDLADAQTAVAATLVNIAYEGDRVLYEVSVGEGVLRIIRAEPVAGLTAGSPVIIGWNAASLILLSAQGSA